MRAHVEKRSVLGWNKYIMVNPKMVCSHCSYFFDLPVALVDFQMLRDLEAVDKVIEMGVIGDILCLFAYTDCPLFLLPLEWWSQPQIYYVITSIWVDLHRITTNLDCRYWKVKFREASWNKLNFGGRIRKSPGGRCEWYLSMHHWSSGQLCQPCNRSFSQKWSTRTSGTVDWR